MEQTLVIIFKPNLESNELTVDSVCIGKYKDKDCHLSTGYYEGFDVTDFNRIDFLEDSNPFDLTKREKDEISKIGFENKYDDKSEIAFVFDERYINAYAQEYSLSFEAACFQISKMAYNTKISFEDKYSSLDKNNICNCKILPHKNEVDDYTIMGMLEYTVSEAIEENKEVDSTKLAMEVIRDINKKIVGQEEATTTLVTNILYNQDLLHELCDGYYYDPVELDSRKVGILIDGTTGTGKTAILKMIAVKLDIPIVIANANSFSETGYVGPTITDLLRKLYFVAGRNLEKAQRGIIILDEIDKLATINGSEGKDMKKGVQEELLGFIGGGEYEVNLDESNRYGADTIMFDTSKITFILSGAFTNLRDKKIKEIEKNNKPQMGFVSSNNASQERTYTITAQDYVDEGLNREFFGRIKVLTCTKTYTFDDLKNILLTSTISPLKNIERTVQMYGYLGIRYSEEFIDEICSQAYEMQTGARSLQTIMSGIQNRLLLGLFNHEYDFYEPIELTTDLLYEYNKTLVRRY